MSQSKSRPLHWRIFAGLFLGLAAGLVVNVFLPQSDGVKWFAANVAYPIGQIFLRLIFMVIIPLIFSAIAIGVADLGDLRRIGRVGLKTALFTVVITAIGVALGILLVNLLKPGAGISEDNRQALLSTLQSSQGVGAILSSAEQKKSAVQTLLDFIPRNPFVDATFAFDANYQGGGLLAIMFFALMTGVAMASCEKERIEPLANVLQSVYDVAMKIIDFAMRFAPFGVAALIFSAASQVGVQLIATLGKYVAVVLLALGLHLIVAYGLILRFLAKRDPIEFFKNAWEAILTAFSTSSSNATLPTAIRVTTERLGVNRDVANFVLTIGSTANQNGTALYEGVTVLFLAQFYGIDLSLSEQVSVALLSILAGVGTAGVPGGSLPLVVLVLQTIGVPVEGIGIILGVDRALDMSRTVVNVAGDITLAAWVDASEPSLTSQARSR